MITLASCAENNENVVYIDGTKAYYDVNLEEREGLLYLPGESEPYSGIITAFLEDGTKKVESEIIEGQTRFGTTFNNDGSIRLKSDRVYHNGQLITLLSYYPDGIMSSSYDIEINPETGKQETKRWYPNGQLQFEATMKDSKYHGVMKYYDESGELLTETMYENGTPVEG